MANCYLCSKNSAVNAFEKAGWVFLKCKNCGLYRLKFSEEDNKLLKGYYDKRFFTGGNKQGYFNYEGDSNIINRNMEKFVKQIIKLKEPGNLLDIGCATGLFMIKAKEKGFDAYGIEMSDYAAMIAKKRFGNKVINSSIEKANYRAGKFDVVTMFDLIEHLINPRLVLKKVFKIMKKNGLLVINTGNVESLLARILGRKWHFFAPPQHLFCFSINTLRTLLDQAGFRIEKIERKGKWFSLRYILHIINKTNGNIFTKKLLSLIKNNLIGKIPVYLNLSDNITVYAIKK